MDLIRYAGCVCHSSC
ncbi:hypothetical protein ACFPH6_23765 [Streptomyces xiangluensis]|uniref:Uncharacterized protein n=1 Tax=Streptomyces xiangluensis TaxID=2665720 RepID=A0ABV8YQE2_9ACTN